MGSADTSISRYPASASGPPLWTARFPSGTIPVRATQARRDHDDFVEFIIQPNALIVDAEGRIIVGGGTRDPESGHVGALLFLYALGNETSRTKVDARFISGLTVSERGVVGVSGVGGFDRPEGPGPQLEGYSCEWIGSVSEFSW